VDHSLYEEEPLCCEKAVFMPKTAERLYQKSDESFINLLYLNDAITDSADDMTGNTSREEN
jgi:hypothetical protein